MKHLKTVKYVITAAGFLLAAVFYLRGNDPREETILLTSVQEEAREEVAAEEQPAPDVPSAISCTCGSRMGAESGPEPESLEPEQPEPQPEPQPSREPETAEPEAEPSGDSRGLVDLNRAGKEELMTLPGIGASRAEAIIRYRQEYGDFAHIEEIMNISGIKEKAFEKIKDSITV